MKYTLSALLILFFLNLSAQTTEVELIPDGIIFPRMNTNQRNALNAVPGQCIYNTNSKAIECYDGTSWSGSASSTPASIVDGDGDTGISVEQNADDDLIRFSVSSIEGMQFDGQTLQFLNTGQSVFIGENSGVSDDLSDNRNTFVGSLSGQANTSGTQNVAVGHQAMKDNVTGSNNVAIGQQALQKNKNSNNIAIGFNAARDNSTGVKNTIVGGFSGFINQSGSENTIVGYEAGRNTSTTSSGNVMIGHQAGMNEAGNDRLYIANDDTDEPLLYGEFDTEKLIANGTFEATETIKVGHNFNSAQPGTIRFNPNTNDFEGWNGSYWLSLTRTMQEGGGVTDINGFTYRTVIIGTQEWMAQNLRVLSYNDGNAIASTPNNTDWSNLTTGGWSQYNNDPSNGSTYGLLYNWYAVDTGNLCPSGWHVPSKSEYNMLANALGGVQNAGSKMKEIGIAHWISPNSAATNESGFTALPGGRRLSSGSFSSLTTAAYFWASGTQFAGNGDHHLITSSNNDLFGSNVAYNTGQSVRCVRN